MNKYHVKIGFKRDDVIQGQALIEALKNRPFIFSKHSINELLRENNPESIGKAIKDYALNFSDVFELTKENGSILKLGFRIPFNTEKDIIFIITSDKLITTLWTNNKNDNHYTLNPINYCKV